jgi:hypothetical protein
MSAARPVTVTDQPEQVAVSSSSASNATIVPSTLRAIAESAAVRSTISPSKSLLTKGAGDGWGR